MRRTDVRPLCAWLRPCVIVDGAGAGASWRVGRRSLITDQARQLSVVAHEHAILNALDLKLNGAWPKARGIDTITF